MLKDLVNIQVLKFYRRLKLSLNLFFFHIKSLGAAKRAFGFEILVRVASYGPQIDQSQLSQILATYTDKT